MLECRLTQVRQVWLSFTGCRQFQIHVLGLPWIVVSEMLWRHLWSVSSLVTGLVEGNTSMKWGLFPESLCRVYETDEENSLILWWNLGFRYIIIWRSRLTVEKLDCFSSRCYSIHLDFCYSWVVLPWIWIWS